MTQFVDQLIATDHLPTGVREFAAATWLGNPRSHWVWMAVGSALGFVVAYAVLRAVRQMLLPRAQRAGSRAVRSVAAAIEGIRPWLLLLIAFAVGLNTLTFTRRTDFWLGVLVFALIGIQLVLCANRAIVAAMLRSVPAGRPVPVMLHIVTWAVQLLVWITFGLALLTNAGVHITAFVASLGVGGIAVALALQNILGDLFASVAIGLDKPFEPGEFIAFGQHLGTVQRVGVKTTRIASLSGEELAIGNAQLLGQLTRNYSRMPERRVVFGFSVPFSTSREQLREITRRTSDVIRGVDRTRFDRGHFTGFGADGFTFEFVYYVLSPDYTLYCDIQQHINDEIIGVVESLGATFAVPARAVALGGNAGAAAGSVG